jgi:hypothetical protein
VSPGDELADKGDADMRQRNAPMVGVLLVGLAPGLALGQIKVEPVKPEGAWCAGSFSLTGGLTDQQYIEAVKGGTSVPEGTNFGPCIDIVKEVRGLDGKMQTVSIPTYPETPALLVSFEADGRILFRSGEVDKDGKPIVKELKRPEIPKQ